MNPDPTIFETTISAEAHTVDIGNGVMANMLTYNGTVPGPEIRLKVGDTRDRPLPEQHRAPDRHPLARHRIEQRQRRHAAHAEQVPPGGKFLYKFKVTRPGIFWYHPHHHSSTNQVFKGLYGTIIIGDRERDDAAGHGRAAAGVAERGRWRSATRPCARPWVRTARQTESLCDHRADRRRRRLSPAFAPEGRTLLARRRARISSSPAPRARLTRAKSS